MDKGWTEDARDSARRTLMTLRPDTQRKAAGGAETEQRGLHIMLSYQWVRPIRQLLVIPRALLTDCLWLQDFQVRTRANSLCCGSRSSLRDCVCWQSTIQRVNNSLQGRGYLTWLDLEYMKGSVMDASESSDSTRFLFP